MLRLIVRCMLPEAVALPSTTRREAAEETIRYVAIALDAAPLHLRAGERIFRVALFFWLLPIARLAPLDRGAGAPVEQAIARFAQLAAPAASIVRLYRSLSLLAFLENEGVLRHIGGESARQRQARFRSIRAGHGAPT